MDDPIYNMLFEREERDSQEDYEPQIKNKVVSSYRGRPRDDLKLANPKEVFKKLNITRALKGDTILDSIDSLLALAKRNAVINESYGDTSRIKDSTGREGLVVRLRKLDSKNGTQYMRILLIDAFAVGALREPGDLRVQHVDNNVLIYPSKGGVARWVK